MSKTTALNVILGVLVAGLLATLLYQETTESEMAPVVTTTTTTLPPTTTTTTTTTTLPPTTTTTLPTTTTTTTTIPIPSTSVAPMERFFTGVLVVNGTSAGERLPSVIARLKEVGYFDVRGVVGAVAAPETVIYYVEPYLAEAQVVAEDLGYDLAEIPILPATEAPPVAGIGVAKVIVYLGPGELPAPPAPSESDAEPGVEETAES